MSINFIPNDPKSTGSKLRKSVLALGGLGAGGIQLLWKVKEGL